MPDTPERRPTDAAPPASRPTDPALQARTHDTDQRHAGAHARGSGDAAHKAKEQARQAGEQGRQQANRMANELKDRGMRMANERKDDAVTRIDGLARALHDAADQCKGREEQRSTGQLLDQAASGLDRLAEMVRSRDVDSMMSQAGELMRRQPAVFIGGTVAAGFLLSRFLKSSASRPYSDEVGYDEEAYVGVGARPDGASDMGTPSGDGYVTSAHVNPDEVTGGRPAVPPVTPTGRRDY